MPEELIAGYEIAQVLVADRSHCRADALHRDIHRAGDGRCRRCGQARSAGGNDAACLRRQLLHPAQSRRIQLAGHVAAQHRVRRNAGVGGA